MRISNSYTSDDWKSLSFADEASWQEAINMVDDRFQYRYWKQIEYLLDNPDRETANNAGFVIMSIACLLIETLEQYRIGKPSTITGMSAKHFHEFFNQIPTFSTFFDHHKKSTVFYKQIRCGLLHQAQIKEKSRLSASNLTPILAWIDNNDPNQGMTINRTKFIAELKIYYQNYLKALRTGDSSLRKNMKLKHESCF